MNAPNTLFSDRFRRSTLPVLARVATIVLLLCLGGCRDELKDAYGQRTGIRGGESVNGTAVLGGMFEQAGHKVNSWHWLSPKLKTEADVIVWFPDDFRPPSEDVRLWLEEWLQEEMDRTLIYVGRDFDATALYWEKIRDPGAPPGEVAEVNRRLSEAKSSFRSARGRIPDVKEDPDCEWFSVSGELDAAEVHDLSGQSDWLDGVDASKVEIRLSGRLTPGEGAEVLLDSEAGPLISRIRLGESQIIIVANGSFLLNLTLVNHEHRKLAASLIDEVGEEKNVFFLESSGGGPRIIDEDPTDSLPTGMEILNVAPLSTIVLHLAGLGMVFCFARLPIFGIARQVDDSHESDFGRHITALGDLLQRTKNRTYAMTRLIHYQQTARGDPQRIRGPGAGTVSPSRPDATAGNSPNPID